MPAIILPDRWRRQPTGPVEINWGNTLTNGLIACWHSTGGIYRDITRLHGGSGALTNVTFVGGLKGLHGDFASGYANSAADKTLVSAFPLSMMCLVDCDSDAGGLYRNIFNLTPAGGYPPIIGFSHRVTNVAAQYYDNSTSGYAEENTSITGTGWQTLGGVWESTTYRALYRNGVKTAESTATKNAMAAAVNRISIGYAPWSGAEFFDGRIALYGGAH
jgi:Concanavalin A-like lectin/glucanases superfamily